MFYKSVKFQLGVIALLFVIFIGVVLFQIYFTQRMQDEEVNNLRSSHNVINTFLNLQQDERRIIETLRTFTRNRDQEVQEIALDEVGDDIGDWFNKLQVWETSLEKWRNESGVNLRDSVFNENFVKNKKKQAESYKKAVKLAREGKLSEVEHILTIEEHYMPSARKTIIAILKGISMQIDANRDLAQRFYVSMVFAVLLALVALVFVSISIARNLTRNLKALEDGALRISNGEYGVKIKVDAPIELRGLAKTFNEMQNTIKQRDEQIREDTQEIQKLNSILEQKVEDRNKTIFNQNISLKRKNEELEQILYAASHDLRTPLISIQGFSEELKTACESLRGEINKEDQDLDKVKTVIDDEIDLALNYIINGSKRMEVLLEGLLRLSRMGRESLQVQKIDMNKLLKNVVDTLSYQLNEAEAELNLDDLDECNGDISQMEQVFFNLISNAIKYRDPARKCKINVSSEKAEGFTKYCVMDNGLGIPDEYLDRVFHAFFRVNDEVATGDGVGLAIVNRAVDLHNGRVHVESQEGKGSMFVVEIPDDVI